MTAPIKTKTFLILLSSLLMTVFLTTCSDDKETITFNHAHINESNLKKHTFEHKFAEQCVKRETRNSVNKKKDKKHYTKPCMCIAKRIMKNLTTVEAEKFLVEKKNTHSLKMSFDEAAYFCVQRNAKLK